MLDDGVGGDDCLDDDILDISPYLLHVVAVALHVRVEGGELPGGEPQAMRLGSPPRSSQATACQEPETSIENRVPEPTGMDTQELGGHQDLVSSGGSCRSHRATLLMPPQPWSGHR